MPATWKKLAFNDEVIRHDLATAANDFLAASGAGAFVKKTLAETKTILGVPPSYALIQDQKDQGTHGGTSTAGAWQTRVLNTEVIDPGNIMTLATNQFTLQAGTYRINVLAPASGNDALHRIKLYNVTDAADVSGCLGLSSVSYSGPGVFLAALAGQFTIAGAKAFEIRHYMSSAYATYGLGRACNFPGYVEIYTQVEIWKIT